MAGINIADAYIQAGQESIYGSEAASITVPFGKGQLVSKTNRHNITPIRGTNSRDPEELVPGKFEASKTIKFSVASGYFLKPAFGAVVDGGSAPYTHTYTGSDNIPSFTVEFGMDLATDSVFKLLGCKVNRLSISGGENEPVTASMDVLYANETEGTSLDTTPATDSESVFGFGKATIEVPTGTTISRVKNWEFTIENALVPVYGTESRKASDMVPTTRSMKLTINPNYEQAARLWEVSSGSTTGIDSPTLTTAQIHITNGLSGSSERTVDINLNGCKIDEHTISADSPEDLVREGVTITATTGSAVYSNNTASDPW